MPDAELVAVCDNVASQLAYAQETFDIPLGFSNIDELLEDVDCDVVVDTASIPAHYEINLKALRAGKHLYSQKPITLTVEEATTLIETAKANNLKISASPIHMLRPTIQTIRKMVQSGALGTIAFARLRSSHGGPEYYQTGRLTDPSWFYEPDAGPLFDLGVHGLHQLTGILGPAKAVACFSGISVPERAASGCGGDYEGVPFPVKIDDTTLMMLDFGDNVFAFIDSTYSVKAYQGPSLEVFGSKGVLSNDRRAEEPLQFYQAYPEGDKERGWSAPESPDEMRYQSIGVRDLLDAIKEDRAPVLTAEHARHVIEIMNKCYVAARERRTVALTTIF